MARTMTVTLTREIETENEADENVIATIVVRFTYTPGTPGRFTGLPENDYDDDPPEVDVDSATIDGEEVDLTEAEMDELYEIGADECGSYPSREPDYDYDYEPI